MLTALRSHKLMRALLWATLILTIPAFVLFYGWMELSNRGLARANRLGEIKLVTADGRNSFEVSQQEMELAQQQTQGKLLSRLFFLNQNQGRQFDFQGWQQKLQRISDLYLLENVADFRALAGFAKDTGLVVPQEIRQEQLADTLEQGGISYEEFRLFLRRSGQTEEDYFESVDYNILIRQAELILSSYVKASLYELWLEYLLSEEEIEVEAIQVALASYMSEVNPTDSEIKDYFAENKTDFTLPDRIKLNYVILQWADFRDDMMDLVTEDQINERYEADKATAYREPPEVEGRHIAIHFGDGDAAVRSREEAITLANQLLTSLKLGADFARLANEFSEDPNNKEDMIGLGGETGEAISERTRTYGDELRDVISKMTAPGLYPEPIVTNYGRPQMRNQNAVFIFKAEEIIPESFKDISEVSEGIKSQLANDLAREEAGRLADEWQDYADEAIDVQDLAESLGIEMNTTEWVSLDRPVSYIGGIGNLSDHREMLQIVYEEGGLSPVLDLSNDRFVVFEMDEESPEHVPQSVDDLPTSQTVITAMKREQGLKLARADVDDFMAELKAADDGTTMGALLGDRTNWTRTQQTMTRQSLTGSLRGITNFARKSLAADLYKPHVEEMGSGPMVSSLILWQLTGKKTPDIAEFGEKVPELERDYLRNKAEAMVEEYLQDLRREGKLVVEPGAFLQ